MKKRNKGFTLIELLVVVLIIGILAAIALPQYQVAVEKTKFLRLIELGDAIHKAEEVYFLEHGVYTRQLGDLILGVSTEGAANLGLFASATDAFLSVRFLGSDLTYVMYWDNHPSSSYRGRRECRVLASKLNNLNRRVCANLTGGTEHAGGEYSWWVFKK